MGLFDKLFGIGRNNQSAPAKRESLSRGGRAEFISPSDGSIVRSEHTAWTMITHPHLEIVRTYQFEGLPPPNEHRKIEIRCRQTKPVGNESAKPLIYFVVQPRMGDGGGFLAANFAPHDSVKQYTAIILRVEATATANQLYVLHEHTDQCLDVLFAGKPIAVQLMSQAGVFASFLLENDRSFRDVYTGTRSL
ncbi:hypothetical protein ACVIGB_006127 [Bradyrhizobium sp. USDA 4341]